MSNFPNMSYCMFENTEHALRQIRNAMEQALEDGVPLDLNQYEMPPYNRLRALLQETLDVAIRHDELINTYEEPIEC